MHLRKSEIKELNEKINGLYKKENLLDKKDNIEKRDNLLLINGKRLFFFKDETPIPTLHFILENGDFLKKITVDKGAVKFVCNGADIMRPGIKNIDENIQKDEFVSIIEETYGKPLAVGIALFDGKEIKSMTKGRAVKTLHYIGDYIWK